MSTFYLAIRVLHILGGALWVGVSVFAAFFLIPAVGDAGPEGGKVMQALERRGYIPLFPVLALTTIFTGVWLYWRYTAGFSPEISRSHAGMAFGLGGALGLIAAIVGGAVLSPAAIKVRKFTQEAVAASNPAARASAISQATAARQRMVAVARVLAVLLILALSLMSIALLI
jgi:hypothetical protein